MSPRLGRLDNHFLRVSTLNIKSLLLSKVQSNSSTRVTLRPYKYRPLTTNAVKLRRLYISHKHCSIFQQHEQLSQRSSSWDRVAINVLYSSTKLASSSNVRSKCDSSEFLSSKAGVISCRKNVGVWVREWVRGLGRRMGTTLSSCTRQDIKFVGDCKVRITIFNITTSKTSF